MRIDEWMLLEGPPGHGPVCLGSFVRPGTGLPAERKQTSPIVGIRYASRVIHTATGSRYRLGHVSDVFRGLLDDPANAWALQYSGLWDRGPADVVDLDHWKELRK